MSEFTIEIHPLWQHEKDAATITAFLPKDPKCDCAIVILPGGAYYFRAEHEGKGYAEFFAAKGIPAFVVDYRCRTHPFPTPLLDARRGVQFVRKNANAYRIDPKKIAIMGSSAGGHLAALCSTYQNPLPAPEDDGSDFLPNAQILCYPVINLYDKDITHADSARNFLGEEHADMAKALSPNLIANAQTPPAFLWHTLEDSAVHVKNSLDYLTKLKQCGVKAELHVFPEGHHGLGLSLGDDKVSRHVSVWTELLFRWLVSIDFLKT